MASQVNGGSPEEFFAQVVAAINSFHWRADVHVQEIGSPQRIAPYGFALEADLGTAESELGSGRLVLLHDPDFNEAWDGFFRLVSFVHADTDFEIVADPLIGEVGWSWLTESLTQYSAAHTAPAGTVTAISSRSFGNMDGQPDRAEIEIRASWTPLIDRPDDIQTHLAAWQHLTCQAAGLPPLPEGVIPLTRDIRRMGSR